MTTSRRRSSAAMARLLAAVILPRGRSVAASAQITKHYTPETLVGKRVMAVVNFPPRQIGPVMSEVLTLGVPDEDGEVVLLSPDRDVPLGGRLF